MKVLVRKNPRVIALEGNTHALTFTTEKKEQNESLLAPRVVVHLLSRNSVSREKKFVPLVNKNVFGCLGLITIQGAIYLAVITGAVTDVALPVPYESVNRIFAVEFVCLSSDEWDFVALDGSGYPLINDTDEYDTSSNNSPSPGRIAHPCWELRKLLLNGLFYFSNNFDLTSLLQNRGVDKSKLEQQNSDFAIDGVHYQEQYMWNSFLMEEMLRFRGQLDDLSAQALERNRFLTTVIRGFAKTTNLGGGNTITIVSKQSWKRAGTRFLSRGIDDDGYVANFVESEFVFYNPSKGLVFAFTQIRGSVPAFWEQDLTLINPKITVTRSIDATQSSFDAHFNEICAKYNACHIVNLLSKTKLLEAELLRRYTELLNKSSHADHLLYTHFDFHAETKPLSGGFAGASKLLPFIHSSLEQFGWFDFDIAVGEVVTRQDGVLRVNCLDCLDRTNLIEQVVCQTVIKHIMLNQSETHGNSGRDRARLEDMIVRHNDLWADNGDAISQIYTGTNALKSSFSRSGKMNLAGALSDVTKSVSRMYQNTFVDSKKQSTIDLLLGKDGRFSIPVQIFDPSSDYVTGKLKECESSYTSYNEISIFTGTYNVNAGTPTSIKDLSSWLFPPENTTTDSPDIYGIGLQELIELNAGSILAGDTSKPVLWAKALDQVLNLQDEQYVLLRTELMSSVCLFLFVKKSKVSFVTQVAGSSKKTGLGGMTANKGACAVRFDYGLTSFALVTSHLAAGVNATIERHNDYSTIMLGLSFTRNLTLSDQDHLIWFGDLNYRLNMTNDRVRSLIEHGAFDELQDFDQLLLEKKERGGAFNGFKEDRILFYPTYKFDRGTSQYDTSEKQRVPSWTDRVLYRSRKGNDLRSINYNSVMDVSLSDHKPVYSTFVSKVKFVDEKKKLELSQKFYNTYKVENGDTSDDARSTIFGTDNDSIYSSNTNGGDNGFASDALADLNLLDADIAPPKPPPRSRTQPMPALPRKVPPPPMSRKAPPSDVPVLLTGASGDIPSHPAMRPSSSNSGTPPPPPRRAATQFADFGISSAPLTPKSYSPVPSSKGSSVDISASTIDSSGIRPIKPVKPSALSATKVDTSSSAGPDVVSLPAKTAKPAPPPSRANASPQAAGVLMTMSDWKPLVPK